MFFYVVFKWCCVHLRRKILVGKKKLLKFKKKPDFPSICAAVAASTHTLTPPLTRAHNNMHVWWSVSHLLVCKKNTFRMRRQTRASPCSVQLRSNMHSNMIYLCLSYFYVYLFTLPWLLQNDVLQLKPAANSILLWSCFILYVCLIKLLPRRSRSESRIASWITSCETLGAAAELSLPSTEASKKNSSAFTSHPVGQTSDSTDALLFLDFDFQTFKMHNFIVDICFELNGDDNWLSAQTGKTLTHMFCF